MGIDGRSALVCSLLFAGSVAAAQSEPKPEAEAEAEEETGAAEAEPADGQGEQEDEGPQLPWQAGPRSLDLGHEIELDLPASYSFLAQPEAGKLLEKMGNLHNEDVLGLVIDQSEDSPWLVVVSYDEAGYVKDDEEIDADDLLESLREGTSELNDERKQQGFSPLKLDGWDEKPHYDKAAHQLVWCLRVSDAEGASANFNTRILGRRGYASLNLVTDPERVGADKPHAGALLAATRFKQGARYQDFDDSSDKVAEYGLAGLVAGGIGLGAMKFGLFAKLGKVLIALLIAGKKALVPLLVGAGVGIKKFFGRGGAAGQGGGTPSA
jgi:uncharacterized membrane-anchored protein